MERPEAASTLQGHRLARGCCVSGLFRVFSRLPISVLPSTLSLYAWWVASQDNYSRVSCLPGDGCCFERRGQRSRQLQPSSHEGWHCRETRARGRRCWELWTARVRSGNCRGRRLVQYPGRRRGLRRLSSGRDEEPAWSPDGSRVAFSRSRDNGRSYEIYVMTAPGGHARAITHGGGFAQSPSGAPDGSRIVFSASGGRFGRSSDPGCAPNVWVMRPNGSGLHRLLARGIQPAHSRGGDRLACVRPDRQDRPWLYLAGAD
jgi:hypothetical protein